MFARFSSADFTLQADNLYGDKESRTRPTAEEVRVDEIVGRPTSGGCIVRRRDDLYVSVDVIRQPGPFAGDVQWIAVARPVEPVFVHPVATAAEEVRIENVSRGRAVLRTHLPQPVENDVETALCTCNQT